MLPRIIECSSFRLRPWRPNDKPALVRQANDLTIWRNLSGNFPHPYTDADADEWLRFAAAAETPEGIYAIDVGGEAVGTFTLARGRNTECFSAEIGCWLGEPFRGRGIVSEAVGRVTDAALAEPDLLRIVAPVAGWNTPSMRVLERNGFVREGILRRAGFKDGVVFDRVIYARTRESKHAYTPVT